MPSDNPEQAADAVINRLKTGDAQNAGVEFYNQIVAYENSHKDVAGKEARFLKRLAEKGEALQQNADLQKKGIIPTFSIEQNGETITAHFHAKTDQGTNGSDPTFTGLDYAHQHPTKGRQEIHASDIHVPQAPLKQMTAKMDSYSNETVTSLRDTSDSNSQYLQGRVQEKNTLNKPQEVAASYPSYPVFSPETHLQSNADQNQLRANAEREQFKADDGRSFDLDKLMALGHPMLGGTSRHYYDKWQSQYVDTQIQIPQAAASVVGSGLITGHLRNGDYVQGKMVYNRDERLYHFVGYTIPTSVGHNEITHVDAPLTQRN